MKTIDEHSRQKHVNIYFQLNMQNHSKFAVIWRGTTRYIPQTST